MGSKPLTWQQGCAFLCSIVALVGAFLAFGADIEDALRNIGIWILLISVPSFIGLLTMHFIAHHRRDLEPDVLAQLVPPATIMQLGDSHFWLDAAQASDRLVLRLLIQNIRDGEGEMRLTLKAKSGRDILGIADANMRVTLTGASLNALLIPIPLSPRTSHRVIEFQVSGSCKSTGTKVRFARRTAVTKPTSPVFTALALLGGQIVYGGGTFLKLNVSPGTRQVAINEAATSIAQLVISEPQDPVDSATVAERFRSFLEQQLAQSVPDPSDITSPLSPPPLS